MEHKLTEAAENCPPELLALKFLRTATQIQGALDADLAPFDLSMQQLRVLAILMACAERKSTVGHIKSQMHDPNSNVSRLLNKLMEKQLIEKHRDAEDQRVVHIHLTQAGLGALAKGKRVMDAHFAQFSKLSASEGDALAAALAKLG